MKICKQGGWDYITEKITEGWIAQYDSVDIMNGGVFIDSQTNNLILGSAKDDNSKIIVVNSDN